MGAFAAGLVLLAGAAALAGALAAWIVLAEFPPPAAGAGLAGALLAAAGLWSLRGRIRAGLDRRRGEIALFVAGTLCATAAAGWLSVRHPVRFDLTTHQVHSLSEQTRGMLARLGAPVRVTFFHDPTLRKSVELYELFDAESDMVSVEFHDPTLNPAAARLLGVRFAGTAVLESEGRRQFVHGPTETDIANGILRVSLGVEQRVCFLDGHVEADPFSTESHDHMEGAAGHSHGLGTQYVLHERHGMAKARHALETINYRVEKVTLAGGAGGLEGCAVLVVAGPKTALLPAEAEEIRAWLDGGNNAFLLLDPFVETGLEPLLRGYGVLADDTIVIDEARHFWADVSAPTVTSYNHHQVTRDLPLTFYPGARSFSPTEERVPGTAVIPVVNSSAGSYGETDSARAEFTEGEDRPGPLTMMVVSTRRAGEGGRSRVVAVGDSDFATNSFFHLLGNGNLFLNVVNYLAAQENLIGIEPRTYDLPEVNMTGRQMKATFLASVVLLPSLLALVGIGVWWRRR